MKHLKSRKDGALWHLCHNFRWLFSIGAFNCTWSREFGPTRCAYGRVFAPQTTNDLFLVEVLYGVGPGASNERHSDGVKVWRVQRSVPTEFRILEDLR